jgi:hypothetical protein
MDAATGTGIARAADLSRTSFGVHPAFLVIVLTVVAAVRVKQLLAQLCLHDAADVADAAARFGVHLRQLLGGVGPPFAADGGGV